jgi:hypothetical protein
MSAAQLPIVETTAVENGLVPQVELFVLELEARLEMAVLRFDLLKCFIPEPTTPGTPA